MRIKKIAPTTPANGNIENSYGTSQTDTYSQEYINGKINDQSSNIINVSYTDFLSCSLSDWKTASKRA